MEIYEGEEETILAPVSPIGQCMSCSDLSPSVIAVLELEIPFDDSQAVPLVKDVFLPIHPRFSSVMVVNARGEKLWKKVEVNIKDHIKFPIFSDNNSIKLYDEFFDEYISKIAVAKFPENKPLWEIHFIKYPTKEATESIILKLHHSLGDGISLMGALLSCLQRADNPAIPLTFPSVNIHNKRKSQSHKIFKIVPKIVSSIYYTVADMFSAIGISSGFAEDDVSPIRSGKNGVEFLPTSNVTVSFSLDSMKEIKTKLGVTINDVISGTIFLGARLYMEEMNKGSGKARATSLVVLNTRMFRGYKSIQEMVKLDSESPWGNNFTFLTIPIPKLNGTNPKDPLKFVWKARKVIQKKRSSFSVFLLGKYIRMVHKFRGAKAVSKFMHATLKNTSMGISNLMGPMEKMALTTHPVNGFYFFMAGPPQSLKTGIVSYMNKLRVAISVEKDFIDPHKLKLCVENAFDMIFNAATRTSNAS